MSLKIQNTDCVGVAFSIKGLIGDPILRMLRRDININSICGGAR